MARICAECRQPVSPVNECICPDDDLEPGEPEDGGDGGDAA